VRYQSMTVTARGQEVVREATLGPWLNAGSSSPMMMAHGRPAWRRWRGPRPGSGTW